MVGYHAGSTDIARLAMSEHQTNMFMEFVQHFSAASLGFPQLKVHSDAERGIWQDGAELLWWSLLAGC